MIDFVLKFCSIYFSLLKKKNYFKDLLPFYCERYCWYYSLLKVLTSFCPKKKKKILTAYMGASTHGKHSECRIGHALPLMFGSNPWLSGLGEG